MPEGIHFTPRSGGAAFGTEAAGQVTTNPPSPTLDPNAQAPDLSYKKISGLDRFVSVNKDAGQSIGHSLNTFFHHPIKALVPALKAAASASIQPFLDPKGTWNGIADYFKNRGFIDGMSQLIYTATNVGTVLAIAGGLGLAGAAALGVGGAVGLLGPCLGLIGTMSMISLVANGGQFLYDEAQAAAPEQGVNFPKWVPLLGGKPLFKKTTHQQQVDLVKFDALNLGGSALLYGVAKVHESMNAPHAAPPPTTGADAPRPKAPRAVQKIANSAASQLAKKALKSNAASYGMMGASMGGMIAAQTPDAPAGASNGAPAANQPAADKPAPADKPAANQPAPGEAKTAAR